MAVDELSHDIRTHQTLHPPRTARLEHSITQFLYLASCPSPHSNTDRNSSAGASSAALSSSSNHTRTSSSRRSMLVSTLNSQQWIEDPLQWLELGSSVSSSNSDLDTQTSSSMIQKVGNISDGSNSESDPDSFDSAEAFASDLSLIRSRSLLQVPSPTQPPLQPPPYHPPPLQPLPPHHPPPLQPPNTPSSGNPSTSLSGTTAWLKSITNNSNNYVTSVVPLDSGVDGGVVKHSTLSGVLVGSGNTSNTDTTVNSSASTVTSMQDLLYTLAVAVILMVLLTVIHAGGSNLGVGYHECQTSAYIEMLLESNIAFCCCDCTSKVTSLNSWNTTQTHRQQCCLANAAQLMQSL